METEKKIIKRKFNGVVLRAAMDKTIVVKVERTEKHKKYGKIFVVARKYKVHDEKRQFKAGDKVVFVECRPISKEKRWRVLYS